MPPRANPALEANECRQCCAFCDRLLLPSGCVESGCPYLYLYDDERSGRRFMGCLNKVFRTEIDVEVFEQAERTRHGFGGVKVTGTPLPRCRQAVERAYQGDGEAYSCVNPAFFDAPAAGPDAPSTFDLRDRL